MITTELYISNTKVDTNEDVVFALNYWMADIREPENRNTDFSKTITIPGTPENNKLFTHIYQIGVDSTFNPNNKADVILFNGGARTFKGYAQLKNIIRQYEGHISYEINLFGENGNLFQSMGESFIDALDFSALSHLKNTATIQASWTGSSGYVYPIINNGQYDIINQPSLHLNSKDMRPCLYVKTIWDKIFDTYGFRYTSSFVSGDPFNKLIMPALGDAKRRTATISGNVNFAVNSTGGVNTHTVKINIRKINNAGITELLYSDQQTSSSSFFPTFLISGNFIVDGLDRIYISTLFTTTDPNATARVIETSEWGIVYSDVTIAGFAPGDFQAGMTIDQNLTIGIETTVAFDDELYDPNSSYNNATYIHTVPIISLASQLPQMKQKDFMIGLIRMFNLYVAPNPLDDKILTILPRDIYYASGTTVDWSPKVDLSRQWTQQPMPFLNFKTHLWKYKQDEDFYNKLYRDSWGVNYGDKELNVDTDFQTETSTIELPFSATPSVQAALNQFILPTIVKENPVDFPSGNVFVGNPRILYYGGMKNTTTAWELFDTGGFSVTNSQYPFASHIDDPVLPTLDILFDAPKQVYFYINPDNYTDNNLYNIYYSKFIEEITDKNSKLVTVYMYLTAYDIQKFDFKNSFYLLNHAFKVNRIIDFNPNTPDVTKVELVKMKEGIAFVRRKVRHGVKNGGMDDHLKVWVSPQDAVYLLINGTHGLAGRSVDSVFSLTGTTNPMAVFSTKDTV